MNSCFCFIIYHSKNFLYNFAFSSKIKIRKWSNKFNLCYSFKIFWFIRISFTFRAKTESMFKISIASIG